MTVPAAIADFLARMRAESPAAQLSSDSRTIAAGDIFLAYPGDAADGRKYIAQAVAKGAVAVVFEAQDYAWPDAWQVPHLGVQGLKKLAGELANDYYSRPDAGMFTVGVTGTNGKTSCTQWLGNALSRLDGPAAVVGTLGVGIYRDGEHAGLGETGYTTPDAVLLQRTLAELRKNGAQALAIEASSIGLDQGRLNGLHFDCALFTNLTRDHLDYHGEMAGYEAAKRMLFDWPGLQHAVINLDDDAGLRLIDHLRNTRAQVPITGYTLAGRSTPGVTVLGASDIRTGHDGTVFQLQCKTNSIAVRTRTVGLFNVSNLLGILGVLMARGTPLETAAEAIASLNPVPGRMQQFGGQDAPLIVIDYAHTPDALEKTLAALRLVAREREGRLWCLFGCGGDRDPGKRAQMGRIARAADRILVTSDNPRTEEPAAIIRQIVDGIGEDKPGTPEFQTIEDRAAAILWAVRHAAKTDVVLMAGKGHEAYQEIKGKKLPFLDADHAALALAARATMKGNH